MPSTERAAPRPVDPRPEVVTRDGNSHILGWACTECGYPSQIMVAKCPRCLSPVGVAEFGPAGVVWSSTVLRIPMPGRTTPYTIAWVDLVDGPRIIAHVQLPEPRVLSAGTSVRLVAAAGNGDLRVEEVR